MFRVHLPAINDFWDFDADDRARSIEISHALRAEKEAGSAGKRSFARFKLGISVGLAY